MNNTEKTIETKLKIFKDIARSKNIPLYHKNSIGTNPGIVNELPNAVVSTNPIPKGTWGQVDNKNGTTERKMFKTAQRMCLSHAIDVFTQELQNGVFDTFGTHRIIFIKEDSEGVPLKLVCQRYFDSQLYLFIFNVYPDNVWDGDPDNIFHGNDIAWFEQQ